MLAGGSVPDTSGRIQACYGAGGTRLVDAPADCRSQETSVSWIQDAPPPIPKLMVVASGNGLGSVESSPPGILCGGACLADFAPGTNVTLVPRTDGWSRFGGWSGACAGTASCVVSMEASKSVGALFTKPDWVTVNVVGGAEGRIVSSPAGIDCPGDCVGFFPYGTEVALTATPEDGAALIGGFAGPRCIRAPANGCTLVVNGPTITEVRFEHVRSLEATWTAAGRITKSPSPVSCEGGFVCTYVRGTVVTIEEFENSNAVFHGWFGDCTGTAHTCVVTMDVDRDVHASFLLAWTLSASTSGTGSGRIVSEPTGIDCPGDCSEKIAVNTQVTLTAIASPGSHFERWGGSCFERSTTNECTLTMGFDHSVVAFFAPDA